MRAFRMKQQRTGKDLKSTPTEVIWHSLQLDEVIVQVEANTERGLSKAEAARRFKVFGPNALPDTKHRGIFSIVVHQFLSPLIYLLLGAAIVAFTIGESRDALVILVVVILNAIIGAIQEGRAEHSLAALRKLSTLKSRILREGQEESLQASEIVPGDIILLSAGDAVPADARFLDGAALVVAEAALTGESIPVAKSMSALPEDTLLADRRNMLFAGTHVTGGRSRALVVTTGIANEIGKIAVMSRTAVQPKTQLEKRIDQFGRYLVVLALLVFALVMGIGLLRGISFSEIFMIAISQMVSLVPEGLPVAVTIALAVGVQRMSKRGTIVRRLSAVETLGS
ncbi:MAG: HAD-IC family P-type ATPase, partial [Verrucomicrobiales bacterium]